jgi:hypothetical protein
VQPLEAKMITTYGLFWKAAAVYWRERGSGNRGQLLGSKTQSSKAVIVDFREQRGIYALYAGYELVYIGQTGAGKDRLLLRLRSHLSDHLVERWDRFSWFGTRWVTKQRRLSADTTAAHPAMAELLNKLEAVAVAIAEPRLNLQRGRWGDAEQYFQVREDEPDMEDPADGGSQVTKELP